MVAGNAIERVHKNATQTFFVDSPDGRRVKISHDAGNLNRIDRVTASSYGMEINQNYCRNVFVELDDNVQMLQAASLYFQSDSWTVGDMAEILWDIASTSMDVLSGSLYG